MYVCMYVFIKLHITTQSGPVILVILCHSHWSSRGGINDTYYAVCMYACMYVCMYLFIKLHITTQSGPVILVILRHSHWSSRGGINDTYYENLWSDAYVCMYVCVCFLPIHSGHDIKFVGRTSRGHTGGIWSFLDYVENIAAGRPLRLPLNL